MIVDCALYVDGKRIESSNNFEELITQAEELSGFVWIGMAEPTESEFNEISERFALHPLAIEDAVNAFQRPKLEEYEGLHFLVAKTVFFKEVENDITTGELMFFVGKNFIVIVRHGEGSPLSNVRHELENHPEQLSRGPWAVVHMVLDRVIDEYTNIAIKFDTAIAELEAKVFSEVRSTESQKIYFLKREVIEFRHAIEPLVFPVQKLAHETTVNCPPYLLPFFRDLDDHLRRACEIANGLDSLLTTVLHADLTHLQLRQNDDMRRISAWVGLAAAPTMIAGIYGMNFQHMPELHWKYGYYVVLGSLLLFSGFLYRLFKKSKWL